ncbi:MAG: sulfotransferase family 2 domain-containing protein [Anaerolineae bacterium]|nr:sulfotransferase family 2 domain-containing protein [Anaerolineae bacterium]
MMTNPAAQPALQSKQLCFMHVPKTGGTSLAKIIGPHFPQSDICELPVWNKLPRYSLDFRRPQFLSGHVYYEIRRLLSPDVLFMTILRDPVERTLSAYEQMRRGPFDLSDQLDWPFEKRPETISIEEFLEPPYSERFVTNLATRYLAAEFDPPISKVQDIAVTVEQRDRLDLEVAKQRLSQFIFVGIMEEFEKTLDLAAYTFGWLRLPSQHLNAAPTRITRAELPSRLLDRIHVINDLDLRLYDYAKALFHERYDDMMETLLRHKAIGYDMTTQAQGAEAIEFDFHQHLSGVGWYTLEVSGNLKWRWTGPGTTSTIYLPPLARPHECELALKITILWVAAPDILHSLLIRVNNFTMVKRQSIGSNGETMIEGTIPAAALPDNHKPIQLSFDVNRTIPDEVLAPGAGNHRSLGLALSQIEIITKRTNPSDAR